MTDTTRLRIVYVWIASAVLLANLACSPEAKVTVNNEQTEPVRQARHTNMLAVTEPQRQQLVTHSEIEFDSDDAKGIEAAVTEPENRDSDDQVRSAVYYELVRDDGGNTASKTYPPLFVGWEQPEVALFVTGQQLGYIEPCGCTGLVNAKGGLSRRHTFLAQMREKGWNVVPVDVGNQVRRFGRQAEIKFQSTVDVLRLMQYQAVGFGPGDLRLSVGELIASVAGDGTTEGPFVCANVDVLGLVPKSLVVSAGGKRIGITSVLGPEARRKINSGDIEFSDPVNALRRVMADLRRKECDAYVLLAHATLPETRSYAKLFGELDVIITAGGAGEPTMEPEIVPGTKARIVQVGLKGIHVGVVGLFDNPRQPVRYQRVVLDSRFGESPKVLDLFSAYQQQLKALGLQGLGLTPVVRRHPSGNTFVGHEVCGECHTTAYEVFESSPHFAVTEQIAQPSERATIPRHFDPECLSCHVTGWNAQEHFPYVSGYLDYDQDTHVHTNGCENCHGPGSQHVAVENGDIDVTDAQRDKLRSQMRMTLEEARKTKCFECHDLDNSPDFQKPGAFEKYWEPIKHEGVD